MRRLRVSVPVRAPGGFTLAYLGTYFQERGYGADGAALRLRLPLHPIARGLSVDKPVAAEVRFIKSHGAPDALAISWLAEGTAFPQFHGAFEAVTVGEGGCRLSLSGTYTAPGGIAGAAFDAVLGSRIARATIEELLNQLRIAVEADYQTRLAM